MATRAVVPEQPGGGGGAKQKNREPEGRNRRALRDIGNVVAGVVAEGKPKIQIARPITRGFQLLANAQAAAGADKKNKKPMAEVVNGAVAKDGIAPDAKEPQKELIKAGQETATVIGPDEELRSKTETPLSLVKLKAASLKKTSKTLTSVLTARSKAACGIGNKLKVQIVDIDAGDVGNELAAVEYVEDIYKFYKLTEKDGQVHDYMDAQPEINSKMRAILVDWLTEVHKKFELMPESLYLTINIVDRFLSLMTIPRRELQLVGISSMLIACKYEEIYAPEVGDFIAISDNAYAREQVLLMEKKILEKLEWYLTVPTPYVFLARYVKASPPSDQEMENMTFFLAELGMVHYSTIICFCPSKLAAAAVYAARCTLNRTPLWTETLKHHTGYSADQLIDCARLLVSFHSDATESKLKAVYRKFSNPDRAAVALFPPAKSLPSN